MLYVVESTKPLDRVADDLEQAVARHKFGILGVHNLKESMAKKGPSASTSTRDREMYLRSTR